MIPRVLRATNYRTYPEVEFDFPAGLTAVVGTNLIGDGADSNGSGKTTLLELLPITLFGPPLPWSEYLTVGSAETVCTVELEFEHLGERYRVRRTFDAKGRGKTTLDFEVADLVGDPKGQSRVLEIGWKPLTMNSQAETQALLNRTIGLGEASFAHSVFAAQGASHFADPALPPRERKAILAEALALGTWDELLKLVKADMAEIQTEADVLTARLGAFEEDLAQKDELAKAHDGLISEYDTVSLALAQAEDHARAAEQMYAEALAARERRVSLETIYHQARQAEEDLAQRLAAMAEEADVVRLTEAELAEVAPAAATAPVLEQEAQELGLLAGKRQQALDRIALLRGQIKAQIEAFNTALTKHADTKAQMVTLTADIAAITAGERHCDRCEQPLLGEAREKAVASVRKDIELLESHAAALEAEAEKHRDEGARLEAQATLVDIPELLDEEALERKRSDLRVARAAVADMARLQERLATAKRRRAESEGVDWVATRKTTAAKVIEAHAALEQVPIVSDVHLGSALNTRAAALDVLAEARRTDRDAQTALATSTERLRSLAVLAERSQEAVAARAGLQGRLEVLTALARSYGRDGIPALILEASAIPQLEAEANRILAQLDARFRFELVTQRENKGGGLKDTLDVVVHGEQGALRYESYSGGEQTRLAFALRIALARLIASRRSAQAGVLILDELAFLDGSGIAKVCEVLRGLSEFRSILLVSHDDRFVDAFDQVVTVVRDEQGSRLETAA